MSSFEWEPQYIQHEGISYRVLLEYIQDRIEFGGEHAIAFPCQYKGSLCYEVRTKRPLGDHHLNDIRTTTYENELNGIIDSPRMVYRTVYHRPLNRVSDYQPPPPPPPRPYVTQTNSTLKAIQMHVHVHGNTTQNISVHNRYPMEYAPTGHYYPPPYSSQDHYYPSPPIARSYSAVSAKLPTQRPPSHCPSYVSQSTI
ncbi:hypothetical protein BJ508DRAFT_50293 [Ascobolus immersus RN42]|uniref:Uncharacterized protein n=1 Tax=Ascobolus immersus RN42 TaxID=1160509 RepID=A0A3N4HH64_ASCIM|nr:hypothetical protein BJ508DRAFT_50293 [Ascobolus immersus RN42]